MKFKAHTLSLAHFTALVLLTIILLPIGIDVAYQVFYTEQVDASRLWFDFEVAATTTLLLSFTLYWLLKKISLKEQQTSDTKKNVAELIDHAADMILITRPSGQIVNANRKACELLGYSQEELKTMQVMDLDLDCTLYRNPKLHQQLFRGDTINFETFYRKRNGEKVPVENHVSTAGWMDGTYYLEITRDITRRHQVQKELHASKEALEKVRNRLESRMHERTQKLVKEVQKRELTEKRIFEIRLLLENLVNSMPSAIIALDNEMRITQWNLEAEKIFGILESSAMGERLLDVLPQHRKEIMKFVRRSNKSLKAFKRNLTSHINGQRRQFEIMVYPLSQTAGSDAPGVVLRLDDITEKAKFDDMLVQTEKMLSLGGLAAGMAHEINNPLGAILQSAQNISRRLSNEFPRNQKIAQQHSVDLNNLKNYLQQQKILDALAAIKEAGERAATIVSDMLSFARPSPSEQSEVDVIDALKTSIRLAEKDYNQKRQFDFRNIIIEENYEDNLPSIGAQKNQLHQVLLNILINAAQALAHQQKDHSPKIQVKAMRQGKYLRIEIKDNGPGMDPQTQKRVFEPFFTTKDEGSGTGLGLSVSYFIVTEQLKGQLLVDSIPGAGTCFSILIPLPPHAIIKNTEEQVQLSLDDF